MTNELDFLRWQEARSKCSLSFAQRAVLTLHMLAIKQPDFDLNELGDLDLIEEAYAWGLRTTDTIHWVEGVLGDDPSKRYTTRVMLEAA